MSLHHQIVKKKDLDVIWYIIIDYIIKILLILLIYNVLFLCFCAPHSLLLAHSYCMQV